MRKLIGILTKANICLVVLAIAGMLALSSCGPNRSATSQIIEQNGGTLAVLKANYLDARTWYNDAQDNFLRYSATLTWEKMEQYNNLLDQCSQALEKWRAALALGSVDTDDPAAFRKARQDLIDAGLMLLSK